MINHGLTRRQTVALVVWLVFCTVWFVETLTSHHYVDAGVVAFGAIVTPINVWAFLSRGQRRTSR